LRLALSSCLAVHVGAFASARRAVQGRRVALHGYVGLHHIYSDDLPIVGGAAAVHLTFSTEEPLDDVARRLVDSGHGDASVSRQEFGAMLTVTDPDGQQVQVHEAPQLA
jgi:hypothetical protein